MPFQNGRSILSQELDLMMETDASLLGWGAGCKGVCTGGLWSPVKRLFHINCLKLIAAMFAVRALSWSEDSSHTHLKLDTTRRQYQI